MSILGRMDEMGSRIDELEQSVVALMDHAGIDRDNINTSFASSSSQNSSLLPSLPRSSAGGSTTPDDMNTTTGGAGNSKLTPSNRTIHSIEI